VSPFRLWCRSTAKTATKSPPKAASVVTQRKSRGPKAGKRSPVTGKKASSTIASPQLSDRSTVPSTIASPGSHWRSTVVATPVSAVSNPSILPLKNVEYNRHSVEVDHAEDITATLGAEAVVGYHERQSKENTRQQQIVSIKAVVKKHIYPYVR
jgi:hypothetical protein